MHKQFECRVFSRVANLCRQTQNALHNNVVFVCMSGGLGKQKKKKTQKKKQNSAKMCSVSVF